MVVMMVVVVMLVKMVMVILPGQSVAENGMIPATGSV